MVGTDFNIRVGVYLTDNDKRQLEKAFFAIADVLIQSNMIQVTSKDTPTFPARPSKDTHINVYVRGSKIDPSMLDEISSKIEDVFVPWHLSVIGIDMEE